MRIWQTSAILLFLQFCFLSGKGYALALSSDTSETICLQSIPSVLAPEIKENKILYTIYFVFDTCPDNYWTYYNKDSNQLILDFYTTYVKKSPQAVIKGAPAVKNMEIKNLQTEMALNGRRSQIILTLDNFWYFEASQVSEKVLRLYMWKFLDPVATLKKEKKRGGISFLVTLISLSAAALTTLVLLAINSSD